MHKYSWSRGPAMACRGILQWNWRGALVLLCIALAWPSLAHAADCPNFNVPDSHTMPSTSPMASGGTITIDASSCDPTGGIAGIEGIFSAPSHGTASVDAVAETVTYTNNGDGATTDFFTFGDPDSNAITVTVSIGAATSPITVTPASLPTPQVGVAYSPVTLIASGGTGPYTYTKTGGSLPPGMTFAGGTFSGTPTHWANYSVSIEVADSAGHSTTKSYALDVPQPTITLSSLPSPAVGVSYNQTITASGGTSPYGNFSVSSGSLPPNLSLSSSGVLSGTPTTAGTYHFVVQAADSSAPTTYYGTHTYDLTVNNATVPGAPTIGTATAGNALAHVSFSPPASNGGAAISSYTAISHPGNLSGNCTSSPCTVNGLTNGTAYTFTVTATNAVGTGAASSASNSVTPSTVPDAPTGVAAASTTSAQATVTFNAAIDNGSAITGYAVTSSPAGGIDANAGTTSLSHVMTGLANGVLYTFTVTATNANGAGPASSPSNSVMPKAAQTITFANPGTQNFGTTPTLTASATSGLTVTFTSTTTTVCTISSGGALAFIAAGTCTIDANQAGNGAYAAAPQVSQSFTVNGILPGAPIIGTATGSDQQATVNFTPPASSGGSPIVGYTATSSSGGNTGTCAASPCTVAGLVNGTSYTFTVTATNGVGTGAASAASNSVIPLGIPTASAKSATATYNTATTIDLTSSITGADITGITVGSGPSHGTATVSGETVTYTPAPSYYGSDSFTYTATNAAGTSTPATVTITVSPAPPSNLAYSPANYFFTKGQASTTATPTYDGTPLTGCTVSPALPTGLSIDTGNCEISGTPTSLSTAPIVYTVTASNPAGSTTAMVTITVNDVAPSNLVYTPGSYTFTQGQAITPATPTYVGGSMTSCTASPALPAGLSISPGNCTISGTPTVSAPSSSYTVIASNSGGSTTAMVTINVLPTAPTVANTSATAAYNTAATIDLTSSITGADITGITVGSGPLHGTTSVSGKTVTYTPSPTYYGGSDSFTYTATNPGGTSTPATVTITVTPPPAPTVANASMTAAYNTTATIDLTSSITGADVTGITVGSGPSHGTVTISGKTVTYTPSSSYYGGSDSFTYTATNPGGTSAPATVSITVGVPAAPTVVAKSVATAYNTPATIDLTGSITGVGITAVTIGMAPAHGTVSVSGETVTYTPSPTYYGGSDSFTYTATNPGGTSAPATVTISVSAPAAPVVTPKSVTTAYNTAASIDLTSSITGVDITAVTIGTAPTHGTVSVSGKVVTYTPSATYYGGADSFTYTATNPGGTSSPATVSITVGAPAAPVVAAKPVTTAYNTAASIDLSGSITGVDITAVTIGTAPTHGTVSVSGKVVTYTPSSTYYGGSDSFTYTATNPGGTSTPATVTISVGAPAAPVVTAKSVTTAYNTAATIDLTGSITGVDITGVTIGTAPAHGSVSVSGETVTYTPSATYYGGMDSFTYTATNPGGTSAPATVTITVGAPAAPVVAAKSVSTAYNTAASIDLSGSITGVDITAVTIGTTPLHGTVSVSGKTVTYTPSATYYGGTDSFTYTATNPGGTSAPATVTITVGAPAAPSAAAKSVSTAYNTAATIDLTGSITGVDITGVTIGTAPAHGTVSVSGKTVTYTPSSSYYGGSDSFTYTATNPGGTSSPATVSITVGAPAAPVVAAKPVTTAYNTAASIDLSGSITGVDITAVTIGTAPTHGTVSVSGKVVTYTPSATYYGGTDSFTYTATNPGGTSSPATVTITVGVPAAPTVAAKSVSTAYNTAATIDLTGSITGVDITDVTIGTAPTHGTVSVSGKTVTYTPSSSYYGGSDSFTYTATNPGGTSSPATVSITVGAPAAPVVAAKPVTTAYNTAASIDLSGSITGVDITAVTIGTAPTHGTVSVSGKVVTYTPSATYYGGTDSFTYTATNPGGTSSPATVTITVGVPAAPTVAAKSISTAYNTAATIDLTGSITGVDITGVTIGTAPTHGTVSVSGKTVTYTPSSSYYGGSDSFTYTATNPGGTSAPAIVSITVGLPAAPTVTAKNVTTVYNTPASIDLSGAITGVDITSVAIASAPSHGTVSVSGKTVTYTPSSTYYGGTDSFTYTATNPGGTSTPATVTMTVTPLSVPTAQALSVTTTTGASVQIQATAGATGPAPFTGVSVAQVPAHGQATASGEQLTYTPATGFTGTDHFTYRIANHFGQSAAATVTVTVTAAGQASAPDGTVTLTTKPNAPVTTNLGNIVPGSFVSSTVLGLSPGGAGQVSISQPTSLTFTSVAGFHGLAQITVLLTAADGHTATVDVLVLVSNQPDPSKNPDVLGLVNAQAMEAQRFAQSQLDNIRQRLESLHDGNQQLFSSTLSMSLNGKPLQGPRMAGAGRLPGQQPGNDTDHPNGLAATTQPDGPMTMRPGIGSAGDNMMMMSDAAMPTSDSTGTSGGHAPPSRGPNGLAAWIDGTAAFGSYDSYRQAAGFDANSIAINTGIDQRVGERGLFGISLGYNHDQSTVANDGTRSIARGYSAAIYGSFAPSAKTYIDAVLGGGGLSFDSRRRDSNDGSYLLGHRNGNQWFGSLTAGYEYHHQRWMISPYGRLEWSYSALNGFAENGDVADALTYGRQNIRTSLAVLGVRTSGLIVTTHAVLVPRARLEIGHEFQGTSDTTLSYAFVPSAGSWNVLSNPYSANGNSVQAGLGLDIQLPRSLTLTTDYSFLMQPHSHSQMIRFGLNKKF